MPEKAVTLKYVTDTAYEVVRESIPAALDNASIREGMARWVPCPTVVSLACFNPDDDTALSVEYRLESSEMPEAMTFMCAKALPYALYTACIDRLKRLPKKGRAYQLPVGTWVAQSIVVGKVTATLTLAVVSITQGDDGTYRAAGWSPSQSVT